jgi:hypothetical protein
MVRGSNACGGTLARTERRCGSLAGHSGASSAQARANALNPFGLSLSKPLPGA